MEVATILGTRQRDSCRLVVLSMCVCVRVRMCVCVSKQIIARHPRVPLGRRTVHVGATIPDSGDAKDLVHASQVLSRSMAVTQILQPQTMAQIIANPGISKGSRAGGGSHPVWSRR